MDFILIYVLCAYSFLLLGHVVDENLKSILYGVLSTKSLSCYLVNQVVKQNSPYGIRQL
jgi:hypothetical protein